MRERFSKALLLRYATTQMRRADQNFERLSGRKIDPSNGTAQCGEATTQVNVGVVETALLLADLRAEYAVYRAMQTMIEDLELEPS